MKSYYRVMLGKGSMYASECFSGNYIGADCSIPQDLTGELADNWRVFNRKFIPIAMQKNPEIKSRISAGLICGALWTIAKGIQKDDIVLCPDGESHYHVGIVTGDYSYQAGTNLPHHRPVQWLAQTVNRSDMSDGLKHSAGSIGTVSNISAHHDEIEKLIAANPPPVLLVTDDTGDDPLVFRDRAPSGGFPGSKLGAYQSG